MAEKRPAPLDFAAKYMEFGGSKRQLQHHYAAGRTAVDRWIAESVDDGSTPKTYDLADLPKGRPAEMVRERGMDENEWRVSTLGINEWTTYARPPLPPGWEEGDPLPEMEEVLNRQTKLTLTPVKEQIVPADVTRWKRPKIGKRKAGTNELVVVCGDQHAPEHDTEFHARFLAWLRENQPTRIVILGDLLENADVSRWEDVDGQASAKESVNSAYDMLRDYIEAAPDAQISWIEGNHDLRIGAYAAKGSPKVAKVSRAGEDQPVLSVPHLMHLDDLGIEYVAGYPLGKISLAPKLVVIHGKIVKKGSGASALGNLEKRGYSVISGHTHRAAIVFRTTLDEHDEPTTHMGAETGTMKKIKPEVFDEAPDHQNAFVTAVIYPDGQFHLEPAIYSAGFLRWRDQRY